MLNSVAERVVAVRGNCDSEVDQMMLEFPCLGDYALVVDEYKTIFATHGLCFGPGKRAAFAWSSMLLSGHTHVKTSDVRDGIIFANPEASLFPKTDRTATA